MSDHGGVTIDLGEAIERYLRGVSKKSVRSPKDWSPRPSRQKISVKEDTTCHLCGIPRTGRFVELWIARPHHSKKKYIRICEQCVENLGSRLKEK